MIVAKLRKAATSYVTNNMLWVNSPEHLAVVHSYKKLGDSDALPKKHRVVDYERHLVDTQRFIGRPFHLEPEWYATYRPITIGALIGFAFDPHFLGIGAGIGWMWTTEVDDSPRARLVHEYLRMRGQLEFNRLHDALPRSTSRATASDNDKSLE